MQSFFHKLSKLRVGWNREPLAEETFHRLCRRFGIGVQKMPLRVNGFYYTYKGKPYIAIDDRLPAKQMLFVMFHELAHHLMHSPGHEFTASFSGVPESSTRDEQEADAFAYCALLPLKMLKEKSPEELLDIEGYGSRFLMERLKVYERYRI